VKKYINPELLILDVGLK